MHHKPVQGGDRFQFIEGMRGVAALYVVLSHFCTMSDPRRFLGQTSKAEPWAQSAMAPFWYGHLAVAAFIVISGFCLQVSLFQSRDGRVHDPKSFFRRRALRILPAYYGCLLISTVVALTVTTSQGEAMPFRMYLPVTVENFLAHLFLVHNWSPAWMYKINGVLWSIAVEIQLYVLFPLLVALLFRVGRWGLLAVGSAVVAAVLYSVPESAKLVPWYLVLFSLGLAAAHAAYRPSRWLGLSPWRGWLYCLGAVAILGYGVQQGWPRIAMDASAGLLAAALLYAGTLAPWSLVARFFAVRPLVWVGGFSYSLYLMHHPIQQIVFVNRPAWVRSEGEILTYLAWAAFPILILGSWLFSLVLEKPFMRRRDPAADDQPVWMPLRLPLRAYEP